MSVNYFVDETLIPDDGSKKIIHSFNESIDFNHTAVYIYPDVHYKKGARVVNGMLISSDKFIYPACLGVDNCGFTFGTVEADSREQLQKSFESYSMLLKDYTAFTDYSRHYIDNLFHEYLERDFRNNREFYDYVGAHTLEDVLKRTKKIIHTFIKATARKSLCSLGGGNHFFEIHEIVETYKENSIFKTGNFIFMLHSDSIGTGSLINLTYSNLSEIDNIQGVLNYFKSWTKHRLWQLFYFTINFDLICSPFEVCKLLFSQKDYRAIKASSRIGKNLLFAHNLASLFGDMNRTLIVENWSKTQNLNVNIIGSHSHDSIRIEGNRIIQRNGVQRVGLDKYFMLPSAMGSYSYIMENSFNDKAFYSANHGLGRMQDKHIARGIYSEKDTCNEIQVDAIKLYRVGGGNIAEQNKKAFKDTEPVIKCMRDFNLGEKVAKTKPIAIIKG